jgi:hypothetical protein
MALSVKHPGTAHLSSTTICSYLRGLAQPYSDIHIIDSAAFQEIGSLRSNPKPTDLRRLRRVSKLKRSVLRKTNIFVFPLCADCHWTVAAVYRNPPLLPLRGASYRRGCPADRDAESGWLIAHYDSAHDDERHRDRVEKVRWALETLLPMTIRSQILPSKYNVARQRDSHSCGPIVCMVAECIVRGLDIQAICTDSSTLQRYRDHIQVFMNTHPAG